MASELALQLAAQAWCKDTTSGKEMDATLCEAFAEILDAWIDTARQYLDNAEYYRGLLDKCAGHIGGSAYISDDGSVMEDPVRANIPELVRRAVDEGREIKEST